MANRDDFGIKESEQNNFPPLLIATYYTFYRGSSILVTSVKLLLTFYEKKTVLFIPLKFTQIK